MNHSHLSDRQGRPTRRYEYDDGVTIVSDLGVADGDASVELLDDTAIVVVSTDGESRQYDVDLPEGGDAQAFMKNGVLTIEVKR